MGRPSLLLARARREGDALTAFVGGHCVKAVRGTLELEL